MSNSTIRLLRHATLLVELNGLRFLVDPMLSDKDAMEPVPQAANKYRIPMTSLPVSDVELTNLLQHIDAVLVTHTHRDHWDEAAQQRIPKNTPLFCQPADSALFKAQGFTQITTIHNTISWKGIQLHRTGGQHGTGEIGVKMGPVSGFVLEGTHSIYIAGDTIWCNEVKDALYTFHPTATVVNAGAAQFNTGGPITMTPEDVIAVYKTQPSTKLIAVHMDTINHCLVQRSDLQHALGLQGMQAHVALPADGETITL